MIMLQAPQTSSRQEQSQTTVVVGFPSLVTGFLRISIKRAITFPPSL
jgi:hypothetical protein